MIRYVGVQGAAMLLGMCAYVFMSMMDVEIVHEEVEMDGGLQRRHSSACC